MRSALSHFPHTAMIRQLWAPSDVDAGFFKLAPEKLIGQTISLEQSIAALMNMDKFEVTGVTVITEF